MSEVRNPCGDSSWPLPKSQPNFSWEDFQGSQRLCSLLSFLNMSQYLGPRDLGPLTAGGTVIAVVFIKDLNHLKSHNSFPDLQCKEDVQQQKEFSMSL